MTTRGQVAALTGALALLAAGCSTDSPVSRGPAEEGPAFSAPRTVADGRLCSGLDESTVADLLGAAITRRDVVRPGDAVQGPGVRAAYYRCDLGVEGRGAPARGLSVSWTPRSGGTAGDSRRSLEGGEYFDDAGCDVDDLPGIDTERGYVETCDGLDRRSDDGSGPYVAPGTAVRVDVGPGHLFCFEYSPLADPSDTPAADVVAACESLFDDLGG